MFWFKDKEKLHQRIDELQSRAIYQYCEIVKLQKKLLDSHQTIIKLRQRQRSLRHEKRRLRDLLDEHNISWELHEKDSL